MELDAKEGYVVILKDAFYYKTDRRMGHVFGKDLSRARKFAYFEAVSSASSMKEKAQVMYYKVEDV